MKNLKDSYSKYLTLEQRKKIPYPTYREVFLHYVDFVMQKVVEESRTWMIPAHLGTICVIGRKSSITFREDGTVAGTALDMKATKEIGSEVYFTNEHSDGFMYRFHWSRVRFYGPFKRLYFLRPCRKRKRQLAKAIKKGVQYENSQYRNNTK